jgi:hypothetical protein
MDNKPIVLAIEQDIDVKNKLNYKQKIYTRNTTLEDENYAKF